MTDNLGVHTGSDATVATDDIGGVHYQEVKLVSGTKNATTPVKADSATGALNVMPYEHHEIHDGSSFTCSYTVDLAQSASANLLIVTPDTTKWAHFGYEVDVEVEAHVYIYEAPTATAAANPIVAYNRDRNSLTAATVVVTHTPTSVTEGTTLIREAHLGSLKNVGGESVDAQEFILKQNTKYLFRVTNVINNAPNYITIRLNWYEHTSL
jgi:hypothetical protein